MNKLLALLNALRKGAMLQNPALWKNVQAGTNALAVFLLALVSAIEAFGVDVQISDDTAHALAGGVVAAVGVLNAYWTFATSEKVGLRTKDDGGPNLGGTEQPFLGD